MSRRTVYNHITSAESLAKILPENQSLVDDFLVYMQSVDRSPNTIKHYKADLGVFFVYNLENNSNKRFTEITKREFARFQNHAINVWNWSPNRLRVMKSTISSLSNFIENMLDEEEGYEGYRSIIKKIESPVLRTVREKTVFSEEELQGLLDHLVEIRSFRKAAVLALAMYSGRRKSEIPRFKVSYFRDENVIFDSLWKTDEKVMTKGRGANGKQIHLYVLKDKFKPYLDLWLEDRKRRGIDSEWLFPSFRYPDKQLSTAVMDDWSKEFSEFLGKDFYWHSMRHYFTTMLVRDNVPANVIQDIVSWDSADMVNLYTDITPDENIGKYFSKKGASDT